MDCGDGADTDCRALQSEAEPQLGLSIVASARSEPKARAVAGVYAKPRGREGMVGNAIPDYTTSRTARGRDDLFRRRGRRAIGLHSGTTWGQRGRTPVVSSTGARFGVNLI